MATTSTKKKTGDKAAEAVSKLRIRVRAYDAKILDILKAYYTKYAIFLGAW